MNKILLPDGIRIGHAHDDHTGVTCILTNRAVGGVSVRGGAPGTRETDMLRAEKSQGFVDAIVLSGGSAYGLEASCGVMQYLFERGVGFNAGDKLVPLVAQAILFDLVVPGEYHYPDKTMGYKAAENAVADGVVFGNVGAGRGATVAKILGPQSACKSGIGAATLTFNDAFVTAVIAVNALGDVYDHKSGKLLAGARIPGGATLSAMDCLTNGMFAAKAREAMQKSSGTNTTIGCVMTNVALDKTHVNKLADVSHDGLALSIRPVHTDADGDTLFALSSGDKQLDYNILAALAVEATALAVENAVKKDGV